RSEFKSYLIIAFAGSPVGQSVSLLLAGNINHAPGDQGPRDTGAQEVLSFIDCARLDHGENEIAGKLLLQVHDIAFGSAGVFGLGVEAAEFLFLADIGAESNDVRLIGFLEPGQNDGGVQAARIS